MNRYNEEDISPNPDKSIEYGVDMAEYKGDFNIILIRIKVVLFSYVKEMRKRLWSTCSRMDIRLNIFCCFPKFTFIVILLDDSF